MSPFNNTIITELAEDYFASGVSLPWNSQYTQVLIEGERLGSFYGYLRDGIVQTGEETPAYTVNGEYLEAGEQKYVDTNEDGIINSDDKQIIGCAQADFTFGFNNSFTYKNFDLSFYIDGSVGNDICNLNNVKGMMFDGGQQNSEVLNRWTEDNPSNIYPRVDSNNSTANYLFSDRIIEDGSYVRLQNVTLGYNLPEAAVKKLRMTRIRVYISAQNICTITGYSGYTPDVSYGGNSSLMMGHDYGSYPNPFTIRAGVNIGF